MELIVSCGRGTYNEDSSSGSNVTGCSPVDPLPRVEVGSHS